VSLHTVKTHVYNVYRKLRVSNRVQAVQWALQNTEGLEGGAG
jgi:DNA-binding CsgD family transcriptional regulator